MKRQVDALGGVASSENAKTIIMPTDIVKAIGSLQVLFDSVGSQSNGSEGAKGSEGGTPEEGPWGERK